MREAECVSERDTESEKVRERESVREKERRVRERETTRRSVDVIPGYEWDIPLLSCFESGIWDGI